MKYQNGRTGDDAPIFIPAVLPWCQLRERQAEFRFIAVAAMDAIGVPTAEHGLPMRASEDFGVLGWDAKTAMLLLGLGKGHAALHNPDYDFPDDLIPIGAVIFYRIARDILGTA